MADEIKQEQAVTDIAGAARDAASGPPPVVAGTTTPSKEAVSVGADQVQAQTDDENAVGYRGHNPDPTPSHHYTVAGVLAGRPTPETDPELAAHVHRALRFGPQPKSDGKKGTK